MYTKDQYFRIRQGDIFRDIEYLEDVIISGEGRMGVSSIIFPYVVVLTQDCDLESDSRARNKLVELGSKEKPISTDTVIESILICPAHEKTLFMSGQHLVEINLGFMQTWGVKDTKWDILTKNRDPRYHLLEASNELGLNEMVIDFKHFYTISRKNIYEKYAQSFVGSMNQIFREQLSQRFAYFLSRIGLPDRDT